MISAFKKGWKNPLMKVFFFREWKNYIKQEEELRGGVRVQHSVATCVAAVAFRLPLVSVDCGPQSATPLPLLVSRLSAACTISPTGPHKTPQKHSRAPQYTTYITLSIPSSLITCRLCKRHVKYAPLSNPNVEYRERFNLGTTY